MSIKCLINLSIFHCIIFCWFLNCLFIYKFKKLVWMEKLWWIIDKLVLIENQWELIIEFDSNCSKYYIECKRNSNGNNFLEWRVIIVNNLILFWKIVHSLLWKCIFSIIFPKLQHPYSPFFLLVNFYDNVGICRLTFIVIFTKLWGCMIFSMILYDIQ